MYTSHQPTSRARRTAAACSTCRPRPLANRTSVWTSSLLVKDFVVFSCAFYCCHTVRQRTGSTKPSAVLRVLRLSLFLSWFSLASDDRLMSRYRHLPTPRHPLPHVSPSSTALHLTITNRSTLSLTAPCLTCSRLRSLVLKNYSDSQAWPSLQC